MLDVTSGTTKDNVGDIKDITVRSDEGGAPGRVRHYPDGGWGWWVVAGCAMSHFLLLGLGRSFGLFYLETLDRYQQTAAATAWVYSSHNAIRQLLGPLAGILCTKFSCRSLVISGGLIISIGCVISSFATSLLFLYLSFSVLAGFGAALCFTPGYIIVSQYFDKKKGKAMGISTLGTGFGTVALAPTISALLVHEGFYGTMLILGAMMLNLCVAGALYRPLVHTQGMKKTEDPIIESKSVEAESKCSKIASTTKILRNTTFILYGFQCCAMSICIMTYLTFLPGIAEQYGASAENAAFLLSILGIVDMFSRFVWGFFFDLKPIRYRRRLFHALMGLPMGGFAILNGTMSSYSGFVVVTVLFALVEGGFHAQRATIVSEFVDKSQMSSTVGFVIGFTGVGNVLGPPIGGFIKDVTGSYDICYYFAGCTIIVTSSLFLLDYFIKEVVTKKNKNYNKNVVI